MASLNVQSNPCIFYVNWVILCMLLGNLIFFTQCHLLTVSFNIRIIRFRGCIVFHEWTGHTYVASHVSMEIHSFNNSLLSTSYVIGNCAELCGTTVSKVEMIPALKSTQPGAEFANRCVETQNEDPGNPHLFCSCGNLGGPNRAGKNLVQQLWL